MAPTGLFCLLGTKTQQQIWKGKTEQHLASAGAAAERAAKPPTARGKPGSARQGHAHPRRRDSLCLWYQMNIMSLCLNTQISCKTVHRGRLRASLPGMENECGLREKTLCVCVLSALIGMHTVSNVCENLFTYAQFRHVLQHMHVWTIVFETFSANWYQAQLDERLPPSNTHINIGCVNTCTSCSYQSGGVVPFDMRQTWKRQTDISTVNSIMRRKATVAGCRCRNRAFHFTCGYD